MDSRAQPMRSLMTALLLVATPPSRGEVICEKGRHVNCLHDRARQKAAKK